MFSLLNYILDYIFPPHCLSCTNFTITADGFCTDCWKKIDFISQPYCKICGSKFTLAIFENFICAKCIKAPPNYDLARSLIKYDLFSKKILHDFKYNDKLALGEKFAKLICYRYSNELEKIDYIVPVPMNRFKRLFRMYNQAQILAKYIAQLINKPLYPDLLIKSKWTKSQTNLSKSKREKNLVNSIHYNAKYSIENKNILLVDDVITTGSTIKHSCNILRKAGAGSICVITIART